MTLVSGEPFAHPAVAGAAIYGAFVVVSIAEELQVGDQGATMGRESRGRRGRGRMRMDENVAGADPADIERLAGSDPARLARLSEKLGPEVGYHQPRPQDAVDWVPPEPPTVAEVLEDPELRARAEADPAFLEQLEALPEMREMFGRPDWREVADRRALEEVGSCKECGAPIRRRQLALLDEPSPHPEWGMRMAAVCSGSCTAEYRFWMGDMVNVRMQRGEGNLVFGVDVG